MVCSAAPFTLTTAVSVLHSQPVKFAHRSFTVLALAIYHQVRSHRGVGPWWLSRWGPGSRGGVV
eukprot:9254033-Heterocapsa_arctica.AAC.1